MARAQTTVISALRNSLTAGQTILLAVSGGADSMALLYAAADLKRALRLRLFVGHINHGLRSSSSSDSDFVSESCGRVGVPCEVVVLRNQPR
ncbi:MAG: hypothetical protein EBZ48_05630, partial [Proteobacteria bacterium]|nr:hypothetical protein [Pseudomonadota bacterium]